MHKIQKVSSYILFILNILLVTIPTMVILSWLLIETPFMKDLLRQGIGMSPVNTPDGLINLADVNWNFKSKLIGFLSYAVSYLPTILSLFVVRTVFRNYRRGRIFIPKNAKQYKYLGGLFFLNAFVSYPVSNTLEILAVTINNPPGQRYFSVSFGTDNLESIVISMIIMVIAWIMLEASRLQEDQQLTV